MRTQMLLLAPQYDAQLHECGEDCVPCARPGCNECTAAHYDGTEECRHQGCMCSGHVIEGDCLDCNGTGRTEEYSYAIGLHEATCDECLGSGRI